MSEIAAEIYAPTPVGPEASIPSDTGNILEDETFLTVEILQLWETYRAYKSTLKEDNQRLRTARHDLSRVLFQMKEVLAKPGRNGQWSAWLKEKEICQATADRLVARYQQSLNPEPNCLTDSISEPTEPEIQKLLKSVLSKMRPVLRTPQSVFRFVDLLTTMCEGVDRRVSDEGILILRPPVAEPDLPDQQVAVVQIAAVEPLSGFQMAPALAETDPDKEWI
jgi:hypothetical protein